ncbi:MAG TPA: HNH endonuclease [Candidatus Baltobacteraceae bacterium]|nr:HNH endonuclease [Candidatus Baltobacteraceae bacterium]
MAKAILTTKVDPTYDDLPEQRYHFPRTYLRQVEAVTGDFVIYYEPRRATGDLSSRGGRQAYFATARIVDVVPDLTRSDHFYALIDSYLDFARAVPFREGQRYYESAIQREDGETNKGAFGRAVRALPEGEYDAILRAGFASALGESATAASEAPVNGLAEPSAIFERPMIERLVARPFREAAFSGSIKAAYDNTCAFTGLKIINGGGRSEVQAAHIRPVAASGPDSLRNGIALCGTVHWMFDRGLISIADDHELLFAKGKVPDQVMRMLTPNRRLLTPARPDHAPHSMFLRWHRENVFEG